MTHRVGAKGQVVIPKTIRDQLGLHPGEEVDFQLDDGGVTVRRARSQRSLMGIAAGWDLVGELERDRRGELERDRRLELERDRRIGPK